MKLKRTMALATAILIAVCALTGASVAPKAEETPLAFFEDHQSSPNVPLAAEQAKAPEQSVSSTAEVPEDEAEIKEPTGEEVCPQDGMGYKWVIHNPSLLQSDAEAYRLLVRDVPPTQSDFVPNSTLSTHQCKELIVDSGSYHTHDSVQVDVCTYVRWQKVQCIIYDGNCPNDNLVGTATYKDYVSHAIQTTITGSNHTSPNRAKHTTTYQDYCTKAEKVVRTYTRSAGCTDQYCGAITQTIEPEVS